MFVLFLNTWHYCHSTPWWWGGQVGVVRSGWGLCHHLWWGVINNICPTIEEGLKKEVGEIKVGWVPFLKFTWIYVQTTARGFLKGEGPHLESVTQSSPALQIWPGSLWDTALQSRLLPFGIFVTLTPTCFSFYLQAALTTTAVFSDFTDSARVCGVLCRIQLHYALHTPIDTLHSPFKIVKKSSQKVFSITVYTLNNWEWQAGICTTASTVNWGWKNNMEDSWSPVRMSNARSIKVIVIVT